MDTGVLTQTPASSRLTIGIFGRTNSGKSSLLNAIAGQDVSLVSPVAGTTTDPVSKPIEIYPLGPCTFLDTAGFGDDSTLGELRMQRTMAAMDKTDLALLVITPDEMSFEEEKFLLKALSERNIPVVLVLNQVDRVTETAACVKRIRDQLSVSPVPVSALVKTGITALREEMVKKAPADFENESIVGHLVQEKDRVLLVVPQDIQAPKGRLILPQVQVIRDLLDHGVVVSAVTPAQLPEALSDHTPDLIITDSQVFPLVYAQKPKESRLTSFSVLMARYKGDIEAYVQGAKVIRTLQPHDKVLIAEACSHQPLDGDIGRIKIPNLIHRKIHPDIKVEIVAGQDFPANLTPYALVIHCGGCMFNRRQVMSRVMRAVEQGVPITNYGIFLAEMAEILDKVVL
ncbi:MAG: [FeFe] hydrogenase H-cluster maturation GTPase HydF [Ruminococcaceae bacterium]|nr:[FeFe] hydrogenase H-cluster maturation GTPase HydF [Oscillospiraceae bacterium]